eukprot:Gb_15766 [translate_table: standard]
MLPGEGPIRIQDRCELISHFKPSLNLPDPLQRSLLHPYTVMNGRQSFSDPPSNVSGGREREMEELRRELEETKYAKERLEIESRSNQEISEKRKRALDDALVKLQEKKKQLDKQTEELNKRAEDIDVAQQKYEEMRSTLMQKESMLRGLSSANEQLRSNFNESQKKMENENKVLVTALDDANFKCEEHERKLKKFVGEIENMKSVINSLQKKCNEAEAIAEEKSKAMCQLESHLESKMATLAVFSENKTHSEVLKFKLAECERNLAQENAQRVLAERAFEELKSRDVHLLKVEQAHNSIQEQLKWRKEQFELLEEAYKKLQQQFQDGKKVWGGEKTGLINEISALQSNLESQCRLSKDLQSQLQRCNQALAHEESRRKVLEIQAEESRYGYEKVAAEFEEARSVIESLTEKSSKEVGSLRDSLALKERQMREMEVKKMHLEQENQELKSTVEEFQASKFGNDEICSSLEMFKRKFTALEATYKECSETLKMKESEWDREREDVLKTLTDCQSDLFLKDGQLHELQSQLERAHSSVERLTIQRAEISQRLLILESESQQAQSKLSAENLSLDSLIKKKSEEIACLKDQLEAKHKAFEQMQQELAQHERTIQTMSTKYESLEDIERQCSAMREELERKQEQLHNLSKCRDHLHHQMFQKEQAGIEEVKKVTEALEEANARLHTKEQRESELQNELSRLQVVVETAHATCAASERQTEEYQNQLHALQQEISAAKHAMNLSEEKSRIDKESLLDVIKARDRKIEELKDQIVHVEQSFNILSQQEETWLEMQLQYRQLSEQRTRELESLTAAKSKLELSAKQLLDKEQERDLLQKRLESKEADLAELRSKNEMLSAERTALIDSIRVQEEKYSKLAEEMEKNKMALKESCRNLEDAQSEIAARDKDIAEYQQKLKHLYVLRQELVDAEEKTQHLKVLLGEAGSSLEDKEEKLSASQRTVEQFRDEVSSIKLVLDEKKKDQAILAGKLTDAEAKLRAKEDQLMEMDFNLNGILKKSEEKQAELDRLNEAMREMEKRAGEWKHQQANMEAQLSSVGDILEEKVTALYAAELEVQRKNDAMKGMEDAIEHLKVQLTVEGKTSFDRLSEMERLHEDLERAKITEHQSSEKLKEMKGRFQELEQRSQDHIQKLQQSMTDLQYELSETHIKMESSEMACKSAYQELISCKEKCATLEEFLSNKDRALKAKETDISSLQTDLLKQAEVIETGQLDLQHAQNRLQCQLEKERSLEEALSLLRNQVTELQACTREQDRELRAFHRDHEATLKELICSRDEVKQLQKKLEQMEGGEGEANSLISQLKEQLALTLQTVNERDICISDLKEQLIMSQARLEELSVATRTSEQTISDLLEKLRNSEGKVEIREKQFVRLQGALEGAEDSLKEESDDLLSLCHSFGELQTLLAEFRVDAESGLKEAKTYAADLRDVTKVIDKLKIQLEMFQKRENDMRSKLVNVEELLEGSQSELTIQAEQIASLVKTAKDLDSDLLEWKNKATASSEDFQCIKSELENANKVICDLQVQLDVYKSTQQGLEEVENLMISSVYTHGLKTELENWKAMATSASEEITMVRLQLKLSEDNIREQNAKIEAYENDKLHMGKKHFTLQEEICNGISGLMDEIDALSFVCSSMEELEGEVLKCRREALLNHEQLRAALSAFKGELLVFESCKCQLQTYEKKQQCMQEQLCNLQSDLRGAYSDLDKEREKADHYVNLMENAQTDLSLWKEKAAAADGQSMLLHTELELANKALDELRTQNEEGLERERHLRDEISATQEDLQNVQCDLLKETRRADRLLSSVKSLEEERDACQEKVRSAELDKKATASEFEDAKEKLSELMLQVAAADKHLQSLQELNQQLKRELSIAQEEILVRKNYAQNMLCQLDTLQVTEVSLQARFLTILDRLLNKGDAEGALGVWSPQSEEEANKEIIITHAVEDGNLTYASCSSGNLDRSPDGSLPETVQVQQLNRDATKPINKEQLVLNPNTRSYGDGNRLQMYDTWLEMQGEQAEQRVQELTKDLAAALTTLSGKEAIIEKLNREVENLQSLVKRLEQRNSQLELYKDSNAIEPERYFHYVELCDSLIRDQLRLKKKLELSQRKSQGLIQQIEEMRQTMPARSALEETKNGLSPGDRGLNENQDENLCTSKIKVQAEFGTGRVSSDRLPLLELNCDLQNPPQVQTQKKGK